MCEALCDLEDEQSATNGSQDQLRRKWPYTTTMLHCSVLCTDIPTDYTLYYLAEVL